MEIGHYQQDRGSGDKPAVDLRSFGTTVERRLKLIGMYREKGCNCMLRSFRRTYEATPSSRATVLTSLRTSLHDLVFKLQTPELQPQHTQGIFGRDPIGVSHTLSMFYRNRFSPGCRERADHDIG